MKALTATLCVALASAKEFDLFKWTDTDTWGDATSDSYVTWEASSVWNWGTRNPAYWAEFMKWHEASVWAQELFTYANFNI